LSPGFLARLPADDQAVARDNRLETHLSLNFGFNLFFLAAAYGLTDSIDVSLALSINQAHMQANAKAVITDPNGDQGAFFTVNQRGVVIGGTGECATDFRCAVDQFDDSAVGTGGVYLRGKWNFANTRYVDVAGVAVLTVPTGNADELLGFHAPTFTPTLVMSKTFGRLSPHVNAGYSFRSNDDVSQSQWIAGADARAFDGLTLALDFLGFHDDDRDDINDDVYQSSVAFKLNPIGNIVIGAGFQFPLNRAGLRADVIYTGALEYTFD